MLYDRDYDEEIRVREEKYKIISDERHELYTEYDALPYFSEEAKAKRALWEQKNKESHVIGAEISRIKKWRDFVYETQIMEDHPYPFMEKYFTDIIGKLLGNDNIREQCPELASLEGKVKLWWSNDDNGVFIFASKNGKPARFSLKDGDKIEDFTWNISVNPLILYRLKSFKGNKLAEEHLVALIAHELGHIWNRVDEIKSNSKIDEAVADFRGIDLMALAGYNPTAMKDVMLAFKDEEVKRKASAFEILLDPHLKDQARVDAVNGKLLVSRRERGTNYDKILEKSYTPIPSEVLTEIKIENKVFATTTVINPIAKYIDDCHSYAGNFYSRSEWDYQKDKERVDEKIKKIEADIHLFPEFAEEFAIAKRDAEKRFLRWEEFNKANRETMKSIYDGCEDFGNLLVKAKRAEFVKNRKGDKEKSTLAKADFISMTDEVNAKWEVLVPGYTDFYHKVKSFVQERIGNEVELNADNQAWWETFQSLALMRTDEILPKTGKARKISALAQAFAVSHKRKKSFSATAKDKKYFIAGYREIATSETVVNVEKVLDGFYDELHSIRYRNNEDDGVHYASGLMALEYKITLKQNEAKRKYLGKAYDSVHTYDVDKVYLAVKALREDMTDENMLNFIKNVSGEVSVWVLRDEIKSCYKNQKDIKYTFAEHSLEHQKAKIIFELSTIDMQFADNYVFGLYKAKNILKMITDTDDNDFQFSLKEMSLVGNFLQDILLKKECYPDNFTDMVRLYTKILSLRGVDGFKNIRTCRIFIDSSADTIMQAMLMKQFLTLSKDDEIIDNSLLLLQEKYRLKDETLRTILFQRFTDSVLSKYGKDDGSKEYKKRIFDFLQNLDETDMSAQDRLEVATILADKLETKRMLSDRMYQIAKGVRQDGKVNAGINALELFPKAMREFGLTDEDLIDFLQKDFDLNHALRLRAKSQMRIEKDEKRGHSSLAWGASFLGLDKTAKDFVNMDFVPMAYAFHSAYWNMTLEMRTAFLSQVISKDKKDNIDLLFKYAFNKLLPKGIAHGDLIKDTVEAYINAHPEGEKMFYLSALMVAIKQNEKKQKDFNIGKPLKDFLENIGPAGIKLGQAIGSYPGTPADIAMSMQELKQNANPPARWEIYDIADMAYMANEILAEEGYKASSVQDGIDVDWYHNRHAKVKRNRKARLAVMDSAGKEGLKDDEPEKLAELGKNIGSGSYYITVDVGGQVLQLLRPFAAEQANSEFNILMKALKTMKGKHPKFANSVEQIIKTAKAMVKIETDTAIGKAQIKTAEDMYPKKDMKINVDGTEYTCRFKVSKWQSGGPDYKIIDKVDGIHFNDMPPSEMKKQIAKLYFEQELKHIFSGGKFDHDRHGAQMKIAVDEQSKVITLGIFDNGAMSVEEPDQNSKERLGEVLDRTVHNVMVGVAKNVFLRKGFNVSTAFTDAVTKNINDTDKKNAKTNRSASDIEDDFKSRDYVLCVQRGLLALNDFMKEIDSMDCLKLFIKTFKEADEQITKPLSSFKKTHLLGRSDELIEKLETMQAKKLAKAEEGIADIAAIEAIADLGEERAKNNTSNSDNTKIDELINLYMGSFVKQNTEAFDAYKEFYNNRKFGKMSGALARAKMTVLAAGEKKMGDIIDAGWDIVDKTLRKKQSGFTC